jgi:hypothetical protein
MKKSLLALAAAFISFAAGIPETTAQPLLYGLTATNSLVRFSASAGEVVSGPAVTGLGAGETIVAIDFRPFAGDLYALTRDGANIGRLYTVNTASGAATPVTLAGASLTITGDVDIDFNPAAGGGVNALRIVTSDEHNYRLAFSGSTATVNVDGAINETNGAPATNVVGTAYTNNRGGLPGGGGLGGTAQYAIDSATDRLYRVNPPNNGTLTEAKPLGIDIDGDAGLDIVTGTDRVLGLFSVAGNRGLYEVSLATGAASLLRSVPWFVLSVLSATSEFVPLSA